MKKNCWEANGCERQPDGSKAEERGVCPAATDVRCDGLNGGSHAGRACWAVAGTLCGDEVQGTFATKLVHCMGCDFYQSVRDEEGLEFVELGRIVNRLK